jgi:hypothetical protein
LSFGELTQTRVAPRLFYPLQSPLIAQIVFPCRYVEIFLTTDLLLQSAAIASDIPVNDAHMVSALE